GALQAAAVHDAGPSPYGEAVGDFNGDGHQDFVVTNYLPSGTVTVRLGKGNGSFRAPVRFAAGPFPRAVAVGAFNRDGIADLAVANSIFGPGTVSVLIGRGNGSFQPPVAYAAGASPMAVTVGDFDGDGKPDLAVANSGAGTLSGAATVSVLRNIGGGTF